MRLDGHLLLNWPLHAIGWQSPREARERSVAQAAPEVRAAGLIAPVLDAAHAVSVELRSPGNDGEPRPLPATSPASAAPALTFRVRSLSNAMVPSSFERDSGFVVLRALPQTRVAGAAAPRLASAR